MADKADKNILSAETVHAATLDLAERVAARLATVAGVAAVTLGGSWARGTAAPDSDIDLGLYYEPARPPSLRALAELAERLGNPGERVTTYGAWGPWVNGGAWLTVEGRRVDWLYRDLGQVRRAFHDCLKGRPSLHRQGGHPHGFHNHIYLGEVHYSLPLYDPGGVLGELKGMLEPYPPKLKQALIESYLWQAGFDLEISRKSVYRGESYYVAGCFFECASSLVQVLFALNERYFVNQKGSLAETRTFVLCPPGFERTVTEVLGRPGTSPQELRRSLERLAEVVEAVRVLAGYPKDWRF